MWGSGGSSCNATGSGVTIAVVPGGPGAYIQGVAYVTPGETLTVSVGTPGAACAFAGQATLGSYACGRRSPCTYSGSGGGATTVSRWNAFGQYMEVIAVSGGGGGAECYSGQVQGLPGTGIDPSGCGSYAPQGSPTTAYLGGGGGGWVGGQSVYSAGAGGSSCAPLFADATAVSLPWYQSTSTSFYVPPAGAAGSPGRVAIYWVGASGTTSATTPSTASMTATSTASATTLPLPSASASPTPSSPPITVSGTMAASATPTAVCSPNAFRFFSSSDLVGTPVGSAVLAVSEAECQRACCASPACTGYAFSAVLLQLVGTGAAPCFLLSNVTQLIPNHQMNSGVLASALES